MALMDFHGPPRRGTCVGPGKRDDGVHLWESRGPPGEALPSVAVTAVSETGVPRRALTDDKGEFSFPFLTPGQYQVFFSLTGFAPYKLSARRSP